jgi:predicted pyridoxine 5'-phosphate oxidase superfamily flavin-nucleotide-binding protein
MTGITEEIKGLMEGNILALATVDGKGNPHAIAVGDIKVVSQNQILIGDNYMVETKKNIEMNGNVSLVVWNRKFEEECFGYELKGTAEYFTEGKWCEMIKKIHEGFPAKGAILVTVNKINKLL